MDRDCFEIYYSNFNFSEYMFRGRKPLSHHALWPIRNLYCSSVSFFFFEELVPSIPVYMCRIRNSTTHFIAKRKEKKQAVQRAGQNDVNGSNELENFYEQ